MRLPWKGLTWRRAIWLPVLSLTTVLLPWLPANADEPALVPPTQRLSNTVLQLTVYLPDREKGYYRGPRFDWSGLVARAEYDGHRIFGEWKTPHDPVDPEGALGTAEEFGMARPLGYAAAKPGETFVKIGVGELEKVDERPYRFLGRYRIVKPGRWQVRAGRGWLEFQQELKGRDGWAYRYVKRLALPSDTSPTFVISHSLKNTGARRIETNQYGHNFITIDEDPVGPDYRLEFPFPARPASAASLNGLADIGDGKMAFRADLKEKRVYAELEGLTGRKSDNAVVVENRRTRAGVRIEGDVPPTEFHVWAVKTAVCPEPFIELKLGPGEEVRWSTRYTFFSRK